MRKYKWNKFRNYQLFSPPWEEILICWQVDHFSRPTGLSDVRWSHCLLLPPQAPCREEDVLDMPWTLPFWTCLCLATWALEVFASDELVFEAPSFSISNSITVLFDLPFSPNFLKIHIRTKTMCTIWQLGIWDLRSHLHKPAYLPIVCGIRFLSFIWNWVQLTWIMK